MASRKPIQIMDAPIGEFIDAGTVALRFGLTRMRIYQLIQEKRLDPPPVQIGQTWLFHKSTKYPRRRYVEEILSAEGA